MSACAAAGELWRGHSIAFASVLAILFIGADAIAAGAQRSASVVAMHSSRLGADLFNSSNSTVPDDVGLPAALSATYPLQDAPTHPVECHDSHCSGHGKCVDNACICFSHYAGADCGVFIPEDVHEECADPSCSGHGRCDVGLCRCDAGWTGSDCDTQARCPQDCNSPSGRCVDGFCICEMGFAGAACDEAVCPHECWGHGTCVHGRCSCYDGWDGDECGEQLMAAQAPAPALSMLLVTPTELPEVAAPDVLALESAESMLAAPPSNGETVHKSEFAQQGTSVTTSKTASQATNTSRKVEEKKPGHSVSQVGAPKSVFLEEMESTAVQQGASKLSGSIADNTARRRSPEAQLAGVPDAAKSAPPESKLASTAVKQVNAALSAAERAIAAAGALEMAGSRAMQQAEVAARQRQQRHTPQATRPNSPLRALPATAVTRRSTNPGTIPKNLFGPAVSEPAKTTVTTSTLPAVVANVPVLAAGACQDGCSGHGTCENGACSCTDGWSGEVCEMEPCPNGCTGRGTCLNGGCLCNAQFYGQACEFSRCLDDCSGHGYCEKGTCQCDPGFSGIACKQGLQVKTVAKGISPEIQTKPTHLRSALQGYRGSLGPKSCPLDCSGNGRCSPDDGTCSCYKGYSGEACQNYCPNMCSGQGRCLNGACICLAGHGGIDCSLKICCSGHGDCSLPGTCVCNPGWLGDQCAVAMACADPKCSGHGTCESGLCQCEPGWAGDTCAVPPSECGGSCPADGTCDRETGTCMCGAGPCGAAQGQNKGDGAKTPAAPSAPGGPNVPGKTLNAEKPGAPGGAEDPDDPSGEEEAPKKAGGKSGGNSGTLEFFPACNKPHGQWNDTVSQCLCTGKWYGENCERQHCDDWDEEAGKPDCSGHGSCVNGECYCSAGWGQKPGKAGPNLCTDTICPIDCGDHGLCQMNACVCQEGWKGPACREPSCQNDCSGHGTCSFVAPQAPAECICEYGFTSPDCSKQAAFKKMETCPNECSGRGLCMAGKCICQEGVQGLDCSEIICPPGKTGPSCEFQACPRDCTGKGLCMNGNCVCEDTHLGADCSIPTQCYDSCSDVCLSNLEGDQCETCKGECMTLHQSPVIGKSHPLLSRVLTLLGLGENRSSSRASAHGQAQQSRLRRRHREVSAVQRGRFWSHRAGVSQSTST